MIAKSFFFPKKDKKKNKRCGPVEIIDVATDDSISQLGFIIDYA